MLASTRAGPASCPSCGASSSRVHSRYQRRLADAALGGRRLVLVLSVRRLVCDATACKRRTFAEQVEGLTVRSGRRTPVLRGMLEQVAVAPAGRAGARLTRVSHAPVSRSTLLRLLMSVPDPEHATSRRGCWGRRLRATASRYGVARATARCCSTAAAASR